MTLPIRISFSLPAAASAAIAAPDAHAANSVMIAINFRPRPIAIDLAPVLTIQPGRQMILPHPDLRYAAGQYFDGP
jgi:hypothetical protein